MAYCMQSSVPELMEIGKEPRHVHEMYGTEPGAVSWWSAACVVHDPHATILHLMGLDHTRLTYKVQGREFRLTGVHGEVVRGLLA